MDIVTSNAKYESWRNGDWTLEQPSHMKKKKKQKITCMQTAIDEGMQGMNVKRISKNIYSWQKEGGY